MYPDSEDAPPFRVPAAEKDHSVIKKKKESGI